MTATQTRDELAAAAYPLVAIEARRFGGLPPGLAVDDLESLGGELLLQAAAEYGGPADGWKRYAKFYLRNRFRAFVARTRDRARRHVPVEVRVEDGGDVAELPRADPRAADPAAIAAAREPLALDRVRQPRLANQLPSPAAVAEQVSRLRAAMFVAVSEVDVATVMRGVVERAKDGSAKDVKLLLDLLAPGRSGVTVNQQAVVIQSGDLS